MADPYHVLGVPRSATKEEIKAAFRKKALIHHPDRHAASSDAVKKAAETTFRTLKEAYEQLTDGNFRYSYASSPGRAGFRRDTAGYNNGGYSYQEYASNTGYNTGRQTGRTVKFSFRSHWRAFTGSGSAALTALLAGVFISGVIMIDPLLEAEWQRRNSGKLFKSMESEILARKK